MSAADWVQGELNARHRQKPQLGAAPVLSDFQRRAVEIMARAMNVGPWNLRIRWERVQWSCGRGVRFTMAAGNGLATWDYDNLTRLVLVAHEECVRIELEPATRGYFYVFVHPRERDGGFCERHPTLEEAVARLAGQ